MARLSDKQREVLGISAEQGGLLKWKSHWECATPQHSREINADTAKSLKRRGLIEFSGEYSNFGAARYVITDLGRKALEEANND